VKKNRQHGTGNPASRGSFVLASFNSFFKAVSFRQIFLDVIHRIAYVAYRTRFGLIRDERQKR